MRIGIIGAGHAGVEAARQARDRGADVVLFSGESVLPYFRPRVVALAFGQVEPDAISIRPKDWYGQNGIDLRLDCPVTELDARKKTVVARGQRETFDGLVIATGASPVLLPIVRELPDDVIALWDVKRSLVIREKLGTAKHLAVLGGGISGVEAALYAVDAGLAVTIIEKENRLMPMQFGDGAAGVLAGRLREKGIHLTLGRCAERVSRTDRELEITLDGGETILCDLLVTTVGARCDVTLFERAGLRADKGVLVDDCLQASVPGVFACGDIAQRDGSRTASVMRATRHGRATGANVVAAAEGREREPVPETVVPLSFKHEDVEFHAVGPPRGANFEETILPDSGADIHRSVLLENGTLRGVQMIGTSADFRQLVSEIGKPWGGSSARA
ncbi:MAG: FAD-dependent oxidoreductase [Sedimentisphaerales bacterium]|nr:FAD-dependent oxidoreductase [Sedimentisphaerales bacterium]